MIKESEASQLMSTMRSAMKFREIALRILNQPQFAFDGLLMGAAGDVA